VPTGTSSRCSPTFTMPAGSSKNGTPTAGLDLPPHEFDLLYLACAKQGDGLLDADITLQTCWDADRLDIGRVGVTVIPSRLCTPAARDPNVVEWADRRARDRVIPDWIKAIWTPPLPTERSSAEHIEGLP